LKTAVTQATVNFQLLLREKLKDTQWEDMKVFKTRSKVVDGKTVSIQAIVRIPVTRRDDVLQASGDNVKQIFTREFVDYNAASQYKFTNLWLQTDKFSVAMVKYSTIPNDQKFGLVWSARGFGVRVRMQDATAISPIITGNKYVVGEKYIVAGIPADVTPQQLFEALSTCDVPWQQITEAQKLTQRYRNGAYSWVIKATVPPPTSLFFLDECVITVSADTIRKKKEPEKAPKVTASAWTKPIQMPTSPANEEPPAKVARMEPPAPADNVQTPGDGNQAEARVDANLQENQQVQELKLQIEQLQITVQELLAKIVSLQT